MDESALEFLPFKSNLGRTSMDRQICLKRKIIYRPASGAVDGVACQSRQTETESIRRREGEQRDRRQQFFLPANPIFCIVIVVAAMIGRGRCRECEGFITLYAL